MSAAMSKERFGEYVWDLLSTRPLGSFTKRELELSLLNAVIKSGLVKETPWDVAREFSLTISKAHAYLTDLALRAHEIGDKEGLELLGNALRAAEVTPDDHYLVIPIQKAALRIWLERKLSSQNLQQGESLRRELVKITPGGLLQILDRSSNGLMQPCDAIKALAKHFKREPWFKESQELWMQGSPWADSLKQVSIGSLSSVLPKVIALMTGLPIA